MDVATHLVQGYLRLNGYLTAAEYPLVESQRGEPSRVVTDIDLLAVRFGRSRRARDSRRGRQVGGPVATDPDPALGCPEAGTDMIVAEVKQGRAFANPATRDPLVLAAALARFGCCLPEEGPAVVTALLQRGTAESALGHTTRMVLFAARGERAPRGWHWVHLDQVVLFMDGYLRKRHATLGGVDQKDPALGWLALLQKCGLALAREERS